MKYKAPEGTAPVMPVNKDLVEEQAVAVETQKAEAPKTEPKVEVVEQSFVGPDRNAILEENILPKYPKMVFKWPYRDDVKHAFKGWKMLRIIKGGTDVEEVATFEEAEHTSATVLCWRSKELDEIHNRPNELKRQQFNKFVTEDPKGVKAANRLLKELAPDGLTAVADEGFVDKE